MTTPISRSIFEHRGLPLSYLDSAPDRHDLPVILLLHGFPDSAEMWTDCINLLTADGYRCIAPDTVGCGESAIADQVSDYRMHAVASDFVELLDHLDVERAIVVGHDWGAVLAWYLAIHHGTRVDRLVAVSVGHPTAYARDGLKQKLLGWYTLVFQLRGIAEFAMRKALPRLIPLHPEIGEVMERLAQPGRMSASIGLYRANLAKLLTEKQPPARCPVMCIWSDRDAYLTESQATNSEQFVEGAAFRYHRLSGGHWIPLDQPDTLCQLILDFLTDARGS